MEGREARSDASVLGFLVAGAREARKAQMRGPRPEESRRRMAEAVRTSGRIDKMLAGRRAQIERLRAARKPKTLQA